MEPDPAMVKQIFLSACELNSLKSASAYLNEVCDGFPELRKEVDALMNAHGRTASLLDNPAVELDSQFMELAGESNFDQSGSTIGPYKLLEIIGKGGMGVVYMAEQKSPIKRRVAVKVVKPGMDTEDVIARFEAERQALAMMDHPNIAKVLDCGTTEEGRPFFVMELVKGVPVTEYCDANKLPPHERIGLFIQVCHAIQHAHQKGIIHRDLKPTNILVAEYDHRAVPKVIDFGIAKALSQQLTEKTMFTRYGQVLGTMEYMSPEQAKVNQLDIDTRSDVFSLGVVLYELLSGVTPFDKKRLRSAAWDEMLRIIREEEPPRPSHRLSTIETALSVAENRAMEKSSLAFMLQNELDWIVMKSMAKERSQRYDSVSTFARDLKRFINGDPVEARPPSFSYVIGRIFKKHGSMILRSVLLMTLLSVGIAASVIYSRYQHNRLAVDGLIHNLKTSDVKHVPEILAQLNRFNSIASPKLKKLFLNSAAGSTERLHAAMGLVPNDPAKLNLLKTELLRAKPREFESLRDFLKPYGGELREDLWTQVSGVNNIGLRAVASLATFDAQSERWADDVDATALADHLVGLPPAEIGVWQSALRPVANHLSDAFCAICRDSQRNAASRAVAASVVADFCRKQPVKLFELLLQADANSFRILFNALVDGHPELASDLAKQELDKFPELQDDWKTREQSASRQANAAILLLLMCNERDLIDAPLPANVRNFIVHRYREFGGKLEAIFNSECWRQPNGTHLKRALLLSAGEFSDPIKNNREAGALQQKLIHLYVNETDPGIHGACEWLLRRFGWNTELRDVQKSLAVNDKGLSELEIGETGWYINSQGQTFSVIQVRDFLMGSPETEPGHMEQETQHRCKVDRRVAASNTEVTRLQWRRYFEDSSNLIDLEKEKSLLSVSHDENTPIVGMTFYEAAGYCNWLSKTEGIPEDQWCYLPNNSDEYGPGMSAHKDFLDRTGYRLPTEAEWEFLCRAGSRTAHCWGDSEAHAFEYAHFNSGSLWKTGTGGLIEVASLKPNDFGMFDMHGNAYERVFDTADRHSKKTNADNPAGGRINAFRQRIVKGGAYDTYSVRSAGRLPAPIGGRSGNGGFRPVRTFP